MIFFLEKNEIKANIFLFVTITIKYCDKSRENVENITDRIIQSVLLNGYIYVSILSDLKRRFIASCEEFEYKNQPNFTKEQSKKLLSEKFSKWKILELGTFHDEQDWPVKSGNYPIEPYHWSGDYVFLIAQKKTA